MVVGFAVVGGFAVVTVVGATVVGVTVVTVVGATVVGVTVVTVVGATVVGVTVVTVVGATVVGVTVVTVVGATVVGVTVVTVVGATVVGGSVVVGASVVVVAPTTAVDCSGGLPAVAVQFWAPSPAITVAIPVGPGQLIVWPAVPDLRVTCTWAIGTWMSVVETGPVKTTDTLPEAVWNEPVMLPPVKVTSSTLATCVGRGNCRDSELIVTVMPGGTGAAALMSKTSWPPSVAGIRRVRCRERCVERPDDGAGHLLVRGERVSVRPRLASHDGETHERQQSRHQDGDLLPPAGAKGTDESWAPVCLPILAVCVITQARNRR